jgi:peptidoglycan biosynthesis protein MviN/MurJ (putative lipid II flippase)
LDPPNSPADLYFLPFTVSGINFIFYYGTTFFKRTGINNPFIITIITNVVNVVMTIPGILIVDKAGRRTLLLAGAASSSFYLASTSLVLSVN